MHVTKTKSPKLCALISRLQCVLCLNVSGTSFMNVCHAVTPRRDTAFALRGFSVVARSVWNSLPADIRVVLLHILSVVFLKPTVLIRPPLSPSGSHKCLRFGLWSILRTIKDFIYLLTYLLTAGARTVSKQQTCASEADS